MTVVSLIFREIIGMFVDDEFLALAILGVVAIVALLMWLAVPGLVAGALLLAGCVAVVLVSALRASRRSRD